LDAELSEEELGYAAGVDRTYYSRVERGEANPTLDKIEALAGALGVAPHELLSCLVARKRYVAMPLLANSLHVGEPVWPHDGDHELRRQGRKFEGPANGAPDLVSR
jgi:transcriptional regulator with XRE-family HTH domain